MSGAVDHYVAEFETLAPRLPGGGLGWLEAARGAALARFRETGFPSDREEAWRYTPVAPISKRRFATPTDPEPVADADVEPFFIPDVSCHRLVFVNGRYAPRLSTPAGLPDGVHLADLATALRDCPERLEPHLSAGAVQHQHAFSALNAAFLGDGAYLELARRVVLAEPLHLVFVSTGGERELASHPRVLVVLAPGARATVVESYATLGDGAHLTNARADLRIGEGACLHHYKLHGEGAAAYHVGTTRAVLGRDGCFHSASLALGGRLVRNDIDVDLAGEGAECELNGLFVATGRQHVDYHTRVEHSKPGGATRQLYKGVLDGRGRGVFDGCIHVHPHAQKSDAHMTNNNILLSRNAEVDTKPQLEIYADDVKCSHGATIGQLDDDMLYYMRTRGIPDDLARGLLTYGFARDVVDRVPVAPLRTWMTAALLERLPRAARLGGLVE